MDRESGSWKKDATVWVLVGLASAALVIAYKILISTAGRLSNEIWYAPDAEMAVRTVECDPQRPRGHIRTA